MKKTRHPKLRGKKIKNVFTYVEPDFREMTICIEVEGKNGEGDCWYFTSGSEVVGRSCYLKGDKLSRSNEQHYRL